MKVLAVIDGSERTGRVLEHLRGLALPARLQPCCSTFSPILKMADCAATARSRIKRSTTGS